LINNVFEFNDITVSEIMRHRKDIFALDINISNEELLHELSKEEYKHSRIPVYDETIDEIKGILYVKDVLKNINKKTFKVKNLIKEAYFVSQNRLINEVFRELQKNKVQIAIVIDEYGGTAGLVTMEDILEELVGDIYDEYDNEEESEIEKIDSNTYMLAGNVIIYDVNKLLDADIPEGDYDTLSGFLQEKLGRIPSEKEKPVIETEKVTYKIEKYKDKRILKVKACKNNVEDNIK
jgi:putative hemolysin